MIQHSPAAKTSGAQIWELAIKIAVPLMFAAGAAVITHEVRMASVQSEITHLHEHVHQVGVRCDILEGRLRKLEIESRIREDK